MCGLAGMVSFDAPPDAAGVLRMAEALQHRGPDDQGSYLADHVALAHVRLSIIDLSPRGHQPMAGLEGRVQLVYNGEIYNYRELRAELEGRGHQFRSESDTEVLLTAYLEWGDACLDRLRGMWSFAIWDARTERLFCSIDRFGIKPLYYRQVGGRFVFASEPKAFVAAGMGAVPNSAVLARYLAYGHVDHGSETFFADTNRLEAAHLLVYDRNGLAVRRYWSLPTDGLRPEDPASAVREAFLESVRLHLRSDVPIGTCLSGGIDSSSVACSVADLLRSSRDADAVGARQRTFTAFFGEGGRHDERPFARAVVESTASEPHWITFDAERLLDDLHLIIRAQDEPFGSTSIVAQWYVMKAAAETGIKVMLDGQGGDELFAGYQTAYGPYLRDLLTSLRLHRLWREARSASILHDLDTKRLVRATLRASVPESFVWNVRARESGALGLLGPRLGPAVAPGKPGTRYKASSALRTYLGELITRVQLPELLRYEDRNSMAHSIEARVPMLDHELVELALSLRGEDLIQDGMTKAVLRHALGDLLPHNVAARTDKIGFVTPLETWWSGDLGEFAREVFSAPACRDRGLVDADECLGRLRDPGRSGFELWRALNVELWAQAYLGPAQRATRETSLFAADPAAAASARATRP